jgi:RNA polymerase sigma factor for flagellar operon FliA
MDKLISQQLPYIKYLAQKYKKYSREDIYGHGVLALVQTAQTYDKKRNIKFYSYSKHRVEGEIIDYISRVTKYNNVFKNLEDQEQFNNFENKNRYIDPAKNIEMEELKEALSKAIEKLKLKQRIIIESYFFHNKKMDYIAKMLGCSISEISRVLKQALKRLSYYVPKIYEEDVAC